MTEEKKHSKRKFLFNPLKRPLPYLGLILAALLIIFHQTIRNYVSDTIGDILVNSMKEATGGVYKTSYDLVRFDMFSGKLKISNLEIELDTVVISREDYLNSRPNLIHINTPLVVVKLRSLWPLLVNNKLYVSYVGAQNPAFSLTKSLRSSVIKDSSKTRQEDFNESINSYFEALEVDSFRVEKGSFEFSTNDDTNKNLNLVHISEFTTMLKNFRLDSLSPSILLKGISATSLELEILNQDVNLPDINQSVHFKKMTLSTNDSTFVLDSLKINNLVLDDTKNHSDIFVNKFEILGFNFEKAFLKNELLVNKLRISNPSVFFKKNNNSASKSPVARFSIFEYFNTLKVNKILLFDGSLNYEAERKSSIENITVGISDYEINTEDWKNRKPVSNFKVDLINARNIEQELPDSIHAAKVEQIIYTGLNNKAVVSKVNFKPLSGRNSYKILRSRNTNLSTYANIRTLTLTHIYPEKLFINNELKIDSVIMDRPSGSILQYPNMWLKKGSSKSKKNDLKVSINHLIANNASIKLRRYADGQKQFTQLKGLYFRSSSINDIINKKLPSDYKLLISEGTYEIKSIGHTVAFNNLSLDENQAMLIENAVVKPDSSSLPYHHINAELSDVLVQGINLNALEKKSLVLDTLSIGKIVAKNDFTRVAFIKSEKPKKNSLSHVRIADFEIRDGDLHIKQGNGSINAKSVSVHSQNIAVDSLQKDASTTVNFSNTLFGVSTFSINNPKEKLNIKGKNAYYNELDSAFTISNLEYESPSRNLLINLNKFNITGFNKDKLINNKEFKFEKLELLEPKINISSLPQSDSLSKPLDVNQLVLKGGLNKLEFDTLQIFDGSTAISLSADNKLSVESFKGIITNYKVDTTSSLQVAVDRFRGVFEFTDINLKGLTDTLNIDRLYLETEQKYLYTDSINFNKYTTNHNLTFKSPGLAIDNINIPKLLENKIAIGRVSTRNNYILLTQTDTTKTVSAESKPSFKIPLDINIDDINFVNTTFEYDKIALPNHLLSNLNFDIELDSLATKKGVLFDLANQSKDVRFRSYNYSFNLPDSLNTVSFDTLSVSTKNEEMGIANLTLKGRYPKYEYGNQVGHQVDWKDMLIEKIKFENVDFIDLVEKKSLKCNKIVITEGYLNLFKDKQLPFPSDRIIPIFQERVKGVSTPIKIDTIEIKSVDIFQTTLQSTGLQEGGISFINTNGLITNVTNDSARLLNNKTLKVVADSKIMGSGSLYANFDFDMLDANNHFSFDARLGTMDAQEFNGILEATAHVSVKSGDIKSINLQATGNKSYAYGNMSFIYSNLKVETVNKETLDKKGMGNALKTFFANAFVVKKKNSRLKLLGRRGEMYYERDQSRITLDYMAKTAISGVVSSIGAKNNRKEIKQINKDNKAARDLELKHQKELQKADKKKAKKEEN